MKLFSVLLVFGAYFFVFAGPNLLKSNSCNERMTKKAFLDAKKLSHASASVWVNTLYDSYKRYSHCMDTKISTNYSASIDLHLKKHPKTVAKLKKYMDKDEGFAKFVYEHTTLMAPTKTNY